MHGSSENIQMTGREVLTSLQDVQVQAKKDYEKRHEQHCCGWMCAIDRGLGRCCKVILSPTAWCSILMGTVAGFCGGFAGGALYSSLQNRTVALTPTPPPTTPTTTPAPNLELLIYKHRCQDSKTIHMSTIEVSSNQARRIDTEYQGKPKEVLLLKDADFRSDNTTTVKATVTSKEGTQTEKTLKISKQDLKTESIKMFCKADQDSNSIDVELYKDSQSKEDFNNEIRRFQRLKKYV